MQGLDQTSAETSGIDDAVADVTVGRGCNTRALRGLMGGSPAAEQETHAQYDETLRTKLHDSGLHVTQVG